MNQFSHQIAFSAGCIITALILALIIRTNDPIQESLELRKHTNEMIETCEYDLSRANTCILIAVPESEVPEDTEQSPEETTEQENPVNAKN